jgi:uncharacterized RDD family membrane protein YckC
MLDTLRVIATPEGVELTLNIAGVVARARAWVIDALIRVVFYIALATALTAFGRFGTGLFLVVLFLLEWAYPVLFEVYWRGATPGKRACHLCVLHDDGTPVGWRASVTRNTLRAVDFLPFFYGFGLIACLLNRDFKRLGDLAAGTVVVYVASATATLPPRSVTAAIGDASQHEDDRRDLLQPIPLYLGEQRAIINFAERRARWSDARAAELAAHAPQLLEGKVGNAAVARLLNMARQFTGRRGDAKSVQPNNHKVVV